jgi:hypothetical protein
MGLFSKMKDAQAQAKEAMGNMGGVSGLAGTMKPGNMNDALQYRELSSKLKASGVEAPAVINSITPGSKELGGSVSTTFEVTIKPADGDAYPATIKQSMLESALNDMSTGEAITVRYDPDDRTSALIYGW